MELACYLALWLFGWLAGWLHLGVFGLFGRRGRVLAASGLRCFWSSLLLVFAASGLRCFCSSLLLASGCFCFGSIGRRCVSLAHSPASIILGTGTYTLPVHRSTLHTTYCSHVPCTDTAIPDRRQYRYLRLYSIILSPFTNCCRRVSIRPEASSHVISITGGNPF